MENTPGVLLFRVRYAETDQMQNYYHARVLEWFEYGRNELLRALGKPYRRWEEDGVQLPLVEVHVRFLGKAQYDDRLKITSSVSMASRLRVRFDARIEHADSGQLVCEGHTVHVVTDTSGKPIRPPGWLVELVDSRRQA